MNEIDLARKALDEAERQVAKYRERVAELEKKPGVWKPECGMPYWTVTGGGEITLQPVATYMGQTQKNIAVGNCFPTREAAEKHVARLKVIQELRELAGGFVPGAAPYWVICYDVHSCEWLHDEWGGGYLYPSVIGFNSAAATKAAIDKLGDRLNVLLEG